MTLFNIHIKGNREGQLQFGCGIPRCSSSSCQGHMGDVSVAKLGQAQVSYFRGEVGVQENVSGLNIIVVLCWHFFVQIRNGFSCANRNLVKLPEFQLVYLKQIVVKRAMIHILTPELSNLWKQKPWI